MNSDMVVKWLKIIFFFDLFYNTKKLLLTGFSAIFFSRKFTQRKEHYQFDPSYPKKTLSKCISSREGRNSFLNLLMTWFDGSTSKRWLSGNCHTKIPPVQSIVWYDFGQETRYFWHVSPSFKSLFSQERNSNNNHCQYPILFFPHLFDVFNLLLPNGSCVWSGFSKVFPKAMKGFKKLKRGLK